MTYTYRLRPPEGPLPWSRSTGTVSTGTGCLAGAGSSEVDQSPAGPSGDGLRLGITVTGARDHRLLGAVTSPIMGRLGLYRAAARCCQVLAGDLAAHPARTRDRRLVEFLEPSWWHTHAATFTGWAQDITDPTAGPRMLAGQRHRRRHELLASIAIEASRRTVWESLPEITGVLPPGWAARAIQQLPRVLYAVEVTAPAPSQDLGVRLLPEPHPGTWTVHDQRTGLTTAVFDAHGQVRTYPSPAAATHAAMNAVTIHTLAPVDVVRHHG